MRADQHKPPFKEQRNPIRITAVRNRLLKVQFDVNSDLFILRDTIITDARSIRRIT